MTALVSLSAGGAITGFSFMPKAAADISSPTSMPLNLVALRQSAHLDDAGQPARGNDKMLRTAIVNVADYYLRMAQTKTPAEMEAIIWRHDSIDGTDHGESCAAFASLTLELAAQVVGQQSWVSGGGSYPWPLHAWADVRVEPNPASLGIVSIQQDAQSQHRWHPLGDGYRPLPGDWVLFQGHVEVVTGDRGGVLHTVGGDSLPNFTVNAHQFGEPLAGAGVVGFVNNGSLPEITQHAAETTQTPARDKAPTAESATGAAEGLAAIPGAMTTSAQHGRGAKRHPAKRPARPPAHGSATAAIPGLTVPPPRSGGVAIPKPAPVAGRDKATRAAHSAAAIPGLGVAADLLPGHHGTAYRRHHPSPARKLVSETQAQQAFISQVAPGAIAAQRRYGVPAAVTIAQAIDESAWGQSLLAAQDHNLFGIKGTGPAGSVPLPTQEYVNGQPVSTSASFRVYHNAAESIDDHGRLLAGSGYYQQAMGERHNPDRFAAALTGVYATDPNYGANLISLMRRYDLYQYVPADLGQQASRPAGAAPGSATIPGVAGAPAAPAPAGSAGPRAASPHPARTARPAPTRTARPQPTRTATPQPTRTATPQPTRTARPQPTRTASPEPTRTAGPQPTRTAGPQPTGTASPQSTGTDSLQPASPASPQPKQTPAPRPTRTDNPQPNATGGAQRAGAAAPPRTDRPRPAASASTAQADIPGVPTQPEYERPMTSAVHFGPAARFVPVARSAPAAARPAPAARPATASRPAAAGRSGPDPVRFGPAARFVPVSRSDSAPARSAPAARPATASRPAAAGRAGSAPVRATLLSTRRYQAHMPRSVLNSFVETAKAPLLSEETLYRDVASFRGISWQLLAACDWMQCDARPRRSPVYGERLGSLNADGTSYTSRSAALARCADDLVGLARTVYGIDLTGPRDLSVRDLANAFAAFRWGALLKAHDCSALEFPYSVAGLTEHHLGMRWPRVAAPGNGDRPGSRFRRPFGAVPIVLGLDYPAIV